MADPTSILASLAKETRTASGDWTNTRNEQNGAEFVGVTTRMDVREEDTLKT